MTTPSTARKAGPLLGNGSTTAFPFTFKVFAAGDIKVAIANSSGVETALILNSDYTVSLNANQDTSPGGTVTYPISGSALPSGSVLSIVGDLDYDQPLDLPSGGNFSPGALENQLDRATMQIQQLKEIVDRSARLPQTATVGDLESLTLDISRLADSASNIDTLVANLANITTVADDLNEPVSEINTVAGNIANVNTVAGNTANINTVVANLNGTNTIGTVAGNIANVNTVAGNIANVNTVAGNTANINTVVGMLADVTTVATNVADITNFSDVYYGPKASDPAARNDATARQVGDLYFNTGSKRMRTFDGAAWVEGVDGAPGAYTVQNFSGNGSTTAFTLSTSPISENNTQVYIGGVYQQKDQYSVSGTTLTFSSAPPSGTNNIEVVTVTTLALGTTTSDLVAYTPAGTGVVATTVQAKLRETVSVKDFGAVGDGVSDDTAAIQAAVNAVLVSGGALYAPEGRYRLTSTIVFSGDKPFIFRGDGNATVFFGATTFGYLFRFDTTSGAHGSSIENLKIEASLSGITDGMLLRNANNYRLTNVWISDQGVGVVLDASYAVEFNSCTFERCKSSGAQAITSAHNTSFNTTNFYTCGVTNSQAAVRFTGGATNNIVLRDSNFEFCYRAGAFDSCTSILVDGCYIEYSTVSDFEFLNSCASVVISNSWLAYGSAPFVVSNVAGFSFSSNTVHSQVVSLGANTSFVQAEKNVVFGTGAINLALLNMNSVATGGNPVLLASGPAANIGIIYEAKGTGGHFFYTGGGAKQFQVLHVANAVNQLQLRGGATGDNVHIDAVGTDSNIGIVHNSKGTEGHYWFTGGQKQFQIGHVTSAVNYWQFRGAATGGNIVVDALGSDSNIGIVYNSKGIEGHYWFTGGQKQFQIGHVANTVNQLQVKGSATGFSPLLEVVGSDTNIDLQLLPKGTGVLRFGTWTSNADAAINGYVTIKDAGGTTRKLATIA